MGASTTTRGWYRLGRTAVLAAGVLALAGCATGYSLVQPDAGAGGAYYTSNGPYGGASYYDDTAGGYYTGGGAAPYYGSVGGYYGFGGFGYPYPWYGAGPTFGLGLGSVCGWGCAGYYGSPIYSIGVGYPWGWGSGGYWQGHHRHDGYHSHHNTAWNDSGHHHDHDHDGNGQHGWQGHGPGNDVADQTVPPNPAGQAGLPSAGFAPQRQMLRRTSMAPHTTRMTELVGPPAVGPGLHGTAAFSRPAEVPVMQSPAPRGFATPAAPIPRPSMPSRFSAPEMRTAPAMPPPMPTMPARAISSQRVR